MSSADAFVAKNSLFEVNVTEPPDEPSEIQATGARQELMDRGRPAPVEGAVTERGRAKPVPRRSLVNTTSTAAATSTNGYGPAATM